MMNPLPENERTWLQAYFSAPNELVWSDIETETASADKLDTVRPWLDSLRRGVKDAPIILPFYRDGMISGWYATAASEQGEQRLRGLLRAWLGPSYLSGLRSATSSNPSAAAMQSRFSRDVIAFTGPDRASIAARLALYADLEAQRPPLARLEPRPVGRIRSDLERALAARDESAALSLIAELRETGRLNEENLQYLDVRLKAGLGQWEQIALDRWTIQNLADLSLPPQTLSDLIEALYRVYIDELEAASDPARMRAVFEDRIVSRFPRLFASRHGVRTPRVVKAFILFEALQKQPDPSILTELEALLPPSEAQWVQRFVPSQPIIEIAPHVETTTSAVVSEAETAYDDCLYDRAFALYMATPLTRKALNHLLSCVEYIGTSEAREQLLQAYDAQPLVRADLPEPLVKRLEALRPPPPAPPHPELAPPPVPTDWLSWARQLAGGIGLDRAESEAFDRRATWDSASLRANTALCAEFADLIGNLDGPAADVARRALPLIIAAFFPEEEPAARATKPIASVVLILIALDEAVARSELDLLSTVVAVLLELGLSTDEYLTTVADLDAIQARVASFNNLAWSLDICEALAVSPAPSAAAVEARLRFFLNVVGQSRGFAHRLSSYDFLPFEFLARDYGVDPAAIADLRPTGPAIESVDEGSDLAGKTVGLYTLTEAAGARAKSALKEIYPLCTVEVNSDTVCTSSLANLARTADIFIFAWRSSSHQAFYCVKDAMGGRDPIYAAGKGTASLINAVRSAAT